ncbi:MAG: GspH/FimT family pseudopilin [Stenotrophobium sp.]
MNGRQRGFTVLELLVTMVVAAVIFGIGVPAFAGMLAKRRVEGAASELQAQLQQLRSQAIKKNSSIFLSFSVDGSNWSYGANDAGACDPAVKGSCKVNGIEEVFAGDAWKGVSVSLSAGIADNSLGFEPRRGMAIAPDGAIGSGTITLQSTAGTVEVNVSPIGYINICSPSGSGVTRYTACSS